MPQQSFKAQVDAWVLETKARAEAVFKGSAQQLFEEALTPVGAGGNLPIDTGFLRASFQASLGAPVTTVSFKTEAAVRPAQPYSLVIAGADLGETVFGVFTASYAGYVEYGTSKMQGRGFVRLAAQRWPQIVAQVTSQAKARAGRRS